VVHSTSMPYLAGFIPLVVVAMVLRVLDDHIRARRRQRRRSEYRRYLRSPSWQFRRQAALVKAAGRCRDCGHAVPLEVHHLTYTRVGREHPKDLRALCRACHTKRHRRRQRSLERFLDWIFN
jgi:5-methylcytosine-specific restriction endonuclease McrA